jgi:hypothetical protein
MAQPPYVDWSRWIFASLTSHFNTHRRNVPLFIEGQYRPETITTFAEFRMDGPYFNEISYAYWKINLTVAILVQVAWSMEDLHKLQRHLGIFQAACKPNITIRQYGDDNSYVGCLRRVDPIRTNPIGQIQSAIKIAQGVIEVGYETNIHILG